MKPSKNRLLLPNFLGIGAPRCGTTWLHRLLASHSDVLMPSRRKELSFFTENFDRGLEWYSKSFQWSPDGYPPTAIGEITPMYLYHDECRKRIRDTGFVERFIVCLRNPVNRLLSGYRMISITDSIDMDLHNFIDKYTDVLTNGYYARALKPWFDDFGRENFLLLKFEDMVKHVISSKKRIASFLKIDPCGFPTEAGKKKIYKSFTPRFPRIYTTAKQTTRWLHQMNLSWIVNMIQRFGTKKLLEASAQDSRPRLSNDQRSVLKSMYLDDMNELEKISGFSVASWLT